MSATDTTHENRLAQETSPYLLQLKHNPVEWWPCCLLMLSRRIMRDWDLEGFAAALPHMTRQRKSNSTALQDRGVG